ncbi:hypothetical protein ACIQZB_19135 [Streptomyces sp. NPDC097727]|uniref:hypothetical protein n=1 Tax=Streptomyces sp. NPDC097727 TaxID=3366092 RepID=UPI0037FC8A14
MPGIRAIDWQPGVVLAAVACTALWWHRSHPRTVVAVIAGNRFPGAPPRRPGLPLGPVPGLERLPELVASQGTAGLKVTVKADGEEKPLSPGVDLTAYRITRRRSPTSPNTQPPPQHR